MTDEPSRGIGRLRQEAIYRAGLLWPTTRGSHELARARSQGAGSAAPTRLGISRGRRGAGINDSTRTRTDSSGGGSCRACCTTLAHRYLTIELFGRVLPGATAPRTALNNGVLADAPGVGTRRVSQWRLAASHNRGWTASFPGASWSSVLLWPMVGRGIGSLWA